MSISEIDSVDFLFEDIRCRYDKRARPLLDSQEVGPGHSKVLARDEKWFITELPEKWKLNFERRREHVSSGYLCPHHVVYKPFANLASVDHCDLLGENLAMNLVKRNAYTPTQLKSARGENLSKLVSDIIKRRTRFSSSPHILSGKGVRTPYADQERKRKMSISSKPPDLQSVHEDEQNKPISERKKSLPSKLPDLQGVCGDESKPISDISKRKQKISKLPDLQSVPESRPISKRKKSLPSKLTDLQGVPATPLDSQSKPICDASKRKESLTSCKLPDLQGAHADDQSKPVCKRRMSVWDRPPELQGLVIDYQSKPVCDVEKHKKISSSSKPADLHTTQSKPICDVSKHKKKASSSKPTDLQSVPETQSKPICGEVSKRRKKISSSSRPQSIHESKPIHDVSKCRTKLSTSTRPPSSPDVLERVNRKRYSPSPLPSIDTVPTIFQEDIKLLQQQNKPIIVYDATKRKKKLPPSKTAGLDYISRELGSHERTLKDLRAGHSLLESMNRETKRQDVLQVIKAPKIVFQKGQPIPIHKPCVYLPPMLPTASSKICLLDAPPKSLVNPGGDGEDEVASHIKKMSRPVDGKDEEENMFRKLQRKSFFAKVKSIYAILCCVHNIRDKELRRYEPFPFDHIKQLVKQPLHTSNIPEHPLHHLYTGSLLAHHHLNLLQNSYYANIIADNKAFHRASLSLWEDILFLHERQLWANASSSAEAHRTTKLARTLPAWKRKVVVVEGDKTVDPNEAIARRVKAIKYFKSEMAQNVKAALQEKEQLHMRTLALHMKHLKCGPRRDKCLNEMRYKTSRIRWAERKKDLEKPDWFVLLEEELHTVFGEDGLEKLGYEALDLLKPFMYISMETIPLVNEKLCLVAMSLPAHYLCIEQVIIAFQFVSEFFLKTSPKLIEQLRVIRQLPPVNELHPPNFLFGMNIQYKI